MTAEADVVWGLGLGCNGAVDIFVEPVDPSAEIFTLYRKAIAEEQALAVVTVLSGAAPAGPGLFAQPRLAMWADGARIGTLGAATMDARAARAGTAAIKAVASRIPSLRGSAGAVQACVE